jgi:hypothetical protein
MLKNAFYLICLIVQLSWSFSQGVFPGGARSMSLANSTVAVTDVWAYFNNPGALAKMESISVGFCFENRYLLKELQSNALAYVHPTKVGVFSFGFQSFGFNLYRNNRVGIGYGLKLSEKLYAGAQLNYNHLRIQNYDSRGNATAELGVLAQLTEKTELGIAIFNGNRARINEYQDERLSTFLRVGINYNVSKKVKILAEAEKEIRSKLRFKSALEYEIVNRFMFRIGGASNPIEITSGFGYSLKNNLRLDFGTAYHQRLGWSPHAGLTFDLKPSKND